MRSCSKLGPMYEAAEGVGRDINAALDLYKKTCTAGSGPDCYHLARHLMRGTYIPRDPVKGAQLLQMACTNSVAGACFDLAVFSMSGPAASQDPVKAARLYQQACDGGDQRGCARVKKPR